MMNTLDHYLKFRKEEERKMEAKSRDKVTATMKAFLAELDMIEEGKSRVWSKLSNKSRNYEWFFTRLWDFGFYDDNFSWDYLDWVRPSKYMENFCDLNYVDINGFHQEWSDKDEEYAFIKSKLMNYRPPEKVWDELYRPRMDEAYESRNRGKNGK